MGKAPDRVIGVVADVRVSSLETSPGSEMYLLVTEASPEGSELVVRSKLPPDVLTPMVMSTLRKLNPAQPATGFRPVEALVDHTVSPRRFFVMLVSIFAGLGLVLAALGIYGVISYSVTRQTQEIGIRMALGATAGHVLLGVLSKTMRLATLGIGFGAIASLAVARWISLTVPNGARRSRHLRDHVILLTGVACAAGFFPARRASSIDPMVALRNDDETPQTRSSEAGDFMP
jgi:ABC-type antimicrobial peptide transport system permease subunit